MAALSEPKSVPVDVSDEEIVARVVQGDSLLFEVLMRRHNPRVYRAIRSLIRDESEVEDAMQAAYLHAFAHLKDFRGGARFTTWLTQIAINEALMRLRRANRHPSVSLSLIEDSAMPPITPLPTPEAATSRREVAQLLERAVDALPEMYRSVFMLREIEGLDTAETAAALEVTEDVVKTRLSRARAALRANLEQLTGEHAPEAFGFHASRCDRVVQNVMRVIQQL